MKPFVERRCRECGEGTIRLLAKEGRQWPYKEFILTLPATLEIPTCSHCGSEWLDADRATIVDAVLEDLIGRQ